MSIQNDKFPAVQEQAPIDDFRTVANSEKTLDRAMDLLDQAKSPSEPVQHESNPSPDTPRPRFRVDSNERKLFGVKVGDLIKDSIQECVSFVAINIVATTMIPILVVSLYTIVTGVRPATGWIGIFSFFTAAALYGVIVGLESRKTNIWFRIGWQLGLFGLIGGLVLLVQEFAIGSALLQFAGFAGVLIGSTLLFKKMAKERDDTKEAKEPVEGKSGWRVMVDIAKEYGVVVLVIAGFVYTMMFAQGAAQSRLYNGKPAPATVYVDQQGQSWTFGQHQGKVILVEFWAPYCGACLKSFPHFQEINEKYSSREDFAMVSVSTGNRERSIEVFESHNADWPLLFEPEESGEQDLRPFSIPAAYIIDQNGNIVASSIRGKKIDKVLESLFQ